MDLFIIIFLVLIFGFFSGMFVNEDYYKEKQHRKKTDYIYKTLRKENKENKENGSK